MISLSYSRISLADIAQKLQLDSPEDAEFIVAKVAACEVPSLWLLGCPQPPISGLALLRGCLCLPLQRSLPRAVAGFRLRPLPGWLGTVRAPSPLSVRCVLSPPLLSQQPAPPFTLNCCLSPRRQRVP